MILPIAMASFFFYLLQMDKAKNLRANRADADQLLPHTMLLEPELRPLFDGRRRAYLLLLSPKLEV